jgi:hypothetical protein
MGEEGEVDGGAVSEGVMSHATSRDLGVESVGLVMAGVELIFDLLLHMKKQVSSWFKEFGRFGFTSFREGDE